ncbi:unnamed protein product [Oppiella nova]|uniref:Methyltransferase-like protein 9 n=1 Tax=Oppiella nova TaxID=334625 RepID=A0A7R9M5X9_9ACAR|nr:unnamed protein product [Oppiella nova]CAG2171382.1 unnamed protein product [Oppiella nova]
MAVQVSVQSCPSSAAPVLHQLSHNCLAEGAGDVPMMATTTSASGSTPVDSHHNPQQQPMPVLLRGSIARSIYERMQREEQLRYFDKSKWYSIDRQLITRELNHTFAPMDYDCETQEFVDLCYQKSDQYFTHLFHSIARTILCLFMSSTSVNGLLGRGSMFVFSDKQFRALLGDHLLMTDSNMYSSSSEPLIDIIGSDSNDSVDTNAGADRVLIDLGAGDGKITEIMSKYFHKTYTTEISPVMRKILLKKGFNVLEVEEWCQTGLQYDVISCLNVLDRCDKPLSMLAHMRSALRPKTGLIVLALVLPFSQYVEVNDNHRADHRPSEVLAIDGHTFEEQLVSFVANVLAPNGLQVVKWSKLPYLCEGDLELTYYWLYDVVLVLKAVGDDQ